MVILTNVSVLGGERNAVASPVLSERLKTAPPFVPKPLMMTPREAYIPGGSTGATENALSGAPTMSSKLTIVAVSGGGMGWAVAVRTSAARSRTIVKRRIFIGLPPCHRAHGRALRLTSAGAMPAPALRWHRAQRPLIPSPSEGETRAAAGDAAFRHPSRQRPSHPLMGPATDSSARPPEGTLRAPSGERVASAGEQGAPPPCGTRTVPT